MFSEGVSAALGKFEKTRAETYRDSMGVLPWGGLVWSGNSRTTAQSRKGVCMGRILRDASKYAVLAAAYASEGVQQGTKLNHDAVGGYRTKTVRAGDFLYISCYPLISFCADRQQRKRLEDMSVDCVQNARLRAKYAKYNNKRRITEFEQIVHASMRRGDLHICCTYDFQEYERYALIEYKTREEAKRDIRNYLRRLRRLLKKHGCDLGQFRWICVTVTKEGMHESVNPRPDRHHHHLLVHGVPDFLRNEVENLWTLGFCNADRLRDSNEGLAAVAGYVARQETSANGENHGARSYATSKNIIRPSVTTSDCKLSRRRAALIAADVRMNGKEIFESLFPGFRMVEDSRVDVSDFTAGAYIYAKLRRIDQRRPQNRTRRTPSRMIA